MNFKKPFAPYMQWKARAIMGHYGSWWKVILSLRAALLNVLPIMCFCFPS